METAWGWIVVIVVLFTLVACHEVVENGRPPVNQKRSKESALGQALEVLAIVLVGGGVLVILGVLADWDADYYAYRRPWAERILWAGAILVGVGSTAGILAGLGVLLQRNATTTGTD
jgi:hypothetical protein